ncbi:hypothetical protein [Photobacterium profundum]|uniref:hypothetical protein n=1 Tax=Photobacterium profundum TaxID=74109 RepID=UPI0002D4CBA4|nr:hypothetical protein [Photobacterium profundum]
MTPLEHIKQLQTELKQHRINKPIKEKVNVMPLGCSDYRYSRTFQVQARRAVMTKGGAL